MPAKINAEILRTMKPKENSEVFFAPNPISRHKNQVAYEMKKSKSKQKSNVPDSPLERGL